jgi:hypothetical protein
VHRPRSHPASVYSERCDRYLRGVMGSGKRVLVIAAFGALPLASIAVACSSTSPPVPPIDAGADRLVDARPGDERKANEAGPDGLEAGAPYLTRLTVSSAPTDGSSAVVLFPAFSPDIFDYYVRCTEVTTSLTVSMTASPGARSLLLQPTPSPALPTQTRSVSVMENQAVVAAATNGTATTQYWVRCLPSDMPELVWSPHPEAGAPPAGYYLVGNLYPPKGTGGYALVLDGHGVPVWYARAPTPLGAATVNSLEPESVTYYPFSPSTVGPFELRQLSPLETSTIAPTGIEDNLHELVVLPDGNYLGLADPFTFGVNLSGLELGLSDGGHEMLGAGSTIQDCEVVEFSPSGEVVSTWLATSHFDPAVDSTFPTVAFAGATAPDGGTVYDVFHCNSIDVDPASGNLLVSARNMDSVFYVDRSSGTVVWKMGGKAASLDNATYVTVKDAFYRQHDARLQPGWAEGCSGGTGQVSVFDDEYDRKSKARGVVYDVVVGGDGGTPPDGGCKDAGLPGATLAWQYQGTSTVALAGSFRILKDGSRVIGWGQGGPSLVFSEVDLDGHDLLDFSYGDSEPSYRAIKVPTSAFDIDVLRSTAGLP